ncbi:hypothetical protein [Pyxidicoccus caerfyrddinensis]|uniref:hypothetical protein n=1 Tax=Pyxidicoccus caerfyrddinensis TaxID=2709663 RepID=UPI0013DBA7B2|nr:hypothetical protein [Pyxidicoccus caerfyrddinensis]
MKTRSIRWKGVLPAAAFAALLMGDLVPVAEAVVGRPATPVSVAGVARRTTRRTVVRTSAYVAALPHGCTTVTINGMGLHQCGATYYQASGSQYVVVQVD